MNDEQSLIQRFFDASLIPSETTDERLNHYQAAAADLAKQFSEAPRDAVSASRVAIDPNCPDTDPWFETVQKTVKVHWKTFLVRNHDAPRQICRAILLEALSIAASKDWTVTLAAWNGSSSLLPYVGSGAEQILTREFITALGVECETHSSEEWSIGRTSDEKLPEFEVKLPSIKTTQVDEKELTNGLSDAAGQHDKQGQDHGNPNPHWPNSYQSWAHEFAPRAANAIANSVNKVLESTSPAIKGLSDKLTPALNKHTSALGEWVIGSSERIERFTALLWWKQALYSPSLQRSYRELSPGGAVIALSFDLGSVSGAPVPLSVEYFFRETMWSLFPDKPEMSLAELVADTNAEDNIDSCLPLAPLGKPHRVSLREFLSVARQSIPDVNLVPAYTGVLATTNLPSSEWAVWLLRERLSEILTQPEV